MLQKINNKKIRYIKTTKNEICLKFKTKSGKQITFKVKKDDSKDNENITRL